MTGAKDAITQYGLKPNKALGQNFLTDEAAIERIVKAASEKGLPILEIGPGLGALTFPLAKTGLPLAAVELDAALCGILSGDLPENALVVNADFLKADLKKIHESLGLGSITAVGNLPYYITSPICARLVQSGLPISRMVLMMQKEAAERFTALPGDKNYVPLTVMARYLFDISPLLELSPASYFPQPEVSSSVLIFDRKAEDLPEGFAAVVKCAFAMRRKTLLNNLSALGLGKSETARLIEEAGLSPAARAETLTENDFARIAKLAAERKA
ncbi:MAG: 16S rRNA (adenine(1518)-N(6)/adenine(1519)-N(6))-dimethyltransferase RsmA [Clostridiales bacterium]|nr:16S rRNA (adenine(1518)-N(6)/adenine(1519)-N(6))-dimethyltransferase RsmA [Clostridiales bacterium]